MGLAPAHDSKPNRAVKKMDDPGAESRLEIARSRFRNALVIDFESVPDGDLFHIGAVLGDKVFERKNIDLSGNPHIQALADHPMTYRANAPLEALPGFSEDLTISILGMGTFICHMPVVCLKPMRFTII